MTPSTIASGIPNRRKAPERPEAMSGSNLGSNQTDIGNP